MRRRKLERIVSAFNKAVNDAAEAAPALEVGASAKRPILTVPHGILVNIDATALPCAPRRSLVADAARLPFHSSSFAVVAGAFVLCSLAHPELVSQEIERVLQPGGRYLSLEHVRATGLVGRVCQGAAGPLHRFFGAGCSLTTKPHLAQATTKFELVSARLWPDLIEPILMAEYRRR